MFYFRCSGLDSRFETQTSKNKHRTERRSHRKPNIEKRPFTNLFNHLLNENSKKLLR